MIYPAGKWAGIVMLCTSLCVSTAAAIELDGVAVQGGLMFGTTQAGNQVFLDDT